MRRLQIMLPEELYERLRLAAFRGRRSLADVIREAVEKHLKEERAMPKEAKSMKAVFVTNNAYDTILVDTLAYPALRVTPDVLRDFCEHPGDWRNWSGDMEPWDEYGDTIEQAAREYGQIVAWYDAAGELHVEDDELWEERRRFYGLA